MKSMEDMAHEKIMLYINPCKAIIKNKEYTLCPGWPPRIAARKAAAANPNFASIIYKIALEMES